MSAHEDAVELLHAVVTALDAGILHFDMDGKALTTPLEVLEALNRDGQVTLQDPSK